MNHPSNAFAALASRAGRGDVQARKQIENDLSFIVRRVLQSGGGVSVLDRRILAEARRCEADAGADPDLLICRVARSICFSIIAGQARHPVRSADETIVNFTNPDMRRSA